MYTNADCTVYFNRNGQYIRQAISNVFWSDSKQSNVLKTGLTSADSVKVLIPIESANNLDFTTGKDLIIKGLVSYDFNNTSPQLISESLKYLNANYSVHTITIADDKRYGSPNMQHYKLSCK
jgi:hypothetical protein